MSPESRGLPTTDAAPAPFTMIEGASDELACEGDACLIPGFGSVDPAR